VDIAGHCRLLGEIPLCEKLRDLRRGPGLGHGTMIDRHKVMAARGHETDAQDTVITAHGMKGQPPPPCPRCRNQRRHLGFETRARQRVFEQPAFPCCIEFRCHMLRDTSPAAPVNRAERRDALRRGHANRVVTVAQGAAAFIAKHPYRLTG